MPILYFCTPSKWGKLELEKWNTGLKWFNCYLYYYYYYLLLFLLLLLLLFLLLLLLLLS